MRTYSVVLVLLVALLASSIIVFVALALTLQPPTVKNIYVSKTYPPTTAHNTTTSLTTSTTTTEVTNTSTTTAAPTTTPIPPVLITCPPDVTVVLGSPLDPPLTGGYANASGGCTLPSPIITYGDALNTTFEARRAAPVSVSRVHFSRQGQFVQGISGHANVFPQKQNQKRSPSFAQNTLFVDAPPFSYSEANDQQPPDATSSASPQYVVQAVNTPQGALVSVLDKNTTQLGFFYMSSLAQNSSCQGPGTLGQPQVLWDQNASAWLLAEIGNDNSTWCFYMSYADNPFGAYKAFAYNFAPFFPNYPKLGIWTRVYELTLALQNLTTNPASMCVIDRLAAIDWTPNANQTLPTIFCGSPLFGLLPKFAFQSWTPASADGGASLPPPYTESSGAGTVGAVFMRPIDDEFLFGANTPTTDLIEVEHWYNVNFTQATYDALRYLVAVQEFDSSFANCSSEFACIPTPTGQFLNPVREVLMQKLSYRHLPQYDQQSIVLCLTSNANGTSPSIIKWFEFRWVRPSVIMGFQWFLHQQGEISSAAQVSLFMPAASMDEQGTILIAYAGSSDTTYPQLGASMRLRNDPTNGIRAGVVLVMGQVGSIILNNWWGSYFSVTTDPSAARNFFVSGQVASNTNPWLSYLLKLRVQGEVYNRTWTAFDYCGNSNTCVQFITAQ